MRIAHRRLVAWADEARQLLGLDDWTLDIRVGNAGEGDGRPNVGSCGYYLDEKHAIITIDTRRIRNARSARDTVIHEVAHCLLADIDIRFTLLARQLYPRNRAARAELHTTYEHLRETVVQRLAKGLARV